MRLSLDALLAASGAAMMVVNVSGCDDVRRGLHAATAPEDAGAISADQSTSASASATSPVVATSDAGGVAAGDAGKKSPPPAPPATSVAKAKKAPPKLNGLPAGAACVQGPEGNGGCASGSECTDGKCTCYNGWTSCDGACRDLSRDPYNCDKCGRECQYGQYCRWGNCEYR